ncbi:heat-inducible transcriptional repressor HrcA [Vagococcus vulneris]|uniref:Heat-inducible transcription repressor HrcA n=1 Tax=Vagococcus vulneris TaxID=1977869 RepID=A0A429ZX44_9ENTE|nr:heat-inducible transcriptional repressor HrcA [Vagococcus vulneris]RST98308.1 heat-inducible transcriptional repressor HrcA [Vagococcus vulneris]
MLSDRQLRIFKLLVDLYTDTKSPIGSNTLKKNGIDASSATIRNELVKLEDLGLIQKVHSSSGRMPSIEGYRYYVDNLLQPSQLAIDEQYEIRQLMNKPFNAADEILSLSAEILSNVTNYTAFSLGPDIKDRTLTDFKLIQLNPYQLIAILITDMRSVESQVFTVPSILSADDLTKMTNLINERLVGRDLVTVYQLLKTEIPLILQRYFANSADMLKLFDTVFAQLFDEEVYVSGGINLLDAISTTEVSQFKSLYSFLNNRDQIVELILPSQRHQVIRIGDELDNFLLKDMSLITTTYTVQSHGSGVIALLGPTAMSYTRLLGLLDTVSQQVSENLEDYYRSVDRT